MVKGCQPYSLDNTVRETEPVKLINKVSNREASNLSGCNESELIGSLVKLNYGSRASNSWAKAELTGSRATTSTCECHRGIRGDTIEKDSRETRETLPRQLCLWQSVKPNPIRHSPKWAKDEEGVGAVHSSNNRWDNITHRSKGTALQLKLASVVRDARLPEKAINGSRKVQELQRKLYLKSKGSPKTRFYSLYDKVCSKDVLNEAWKCVKKNGGSAGADRQTIKQVKEKVGEKEFLKGLREELRAKTYKVQPVKRVYIPKPKGKKRGLGIPTVKDRVVQSAVKIVIEPIFEAEFKDCSYGFRPKRSALQAIERVSYLVRRGRSKVVDADIEKYFDRVPHQELLRECAKRIADGQILYLLKMWLKAGILEEGAIKGNEIGTPQGGVISPLLANIYLHQLDEYWSENEPPKKRDTHLVRYADDIIILTSGQVRQSLSYLEKEIKRLKLELNPEKTSLKDIKKEKLEFLGYGMRGVLSSRKKWFCLCYPSARGMENIRTKVQNLLYPRQPKAIEEVIPQLNRVIRGWTNYYRSGNSSKWFRKVRYYVEKKVRRFIQVKRHKSGYGWRTISSAYLYGELGLYNNYRVIYRRA